MPTPLPEPFDRIYRLVGRRSHPVDWPKSYDFFDAYDEHDGFLLTLHYKALGQLLNAQHFAHNVQVEFEDDLDHTRSVLVPPTCTLDLTMRLTFGEGYYVDNPDTLKSKAEMMQILQAALTSP